MQRTSISWCDYSSNPLYAEADGQRGWYCTKVSRGCRNCYAETLNLRFGNGVPYTEANRGRVTWKLRESEFAAWARLKTPSRIFVCDMTDWCHEDIDVKALQMIWGVMAACHWHTFMLLTKRPERMRALLTDEDFQFHIGWFQSAFEREYDLPRDVAPTGCPNVMLGVSVEDQETADERIPLLLETPAARRFVSYEPALGPVDFDQYLEAVTDGDWIHHAFEGKWDEGLAKATGRGGPYCTQCGGREPNVLHKPHDDEYCGGDCDRGDSGGRMRVLVPRLDLVIVGGESGPHHRPLDLAWVRALREDCRLVGVPWHGKQDAGVRPGKPLPGDLGDQEMPR